MLDKATKERLIKAGLSEQEIDAIIERAKVMSDYLDMRGIAHKSIKENEQPLDPASLILSKMFGNGEKPKRKKMKVDYDQLTPSETILAKMFGYEGE